MSSSEHGSLGRRHPNDVAVAVQAPLAKQVVAIAVSAALLLVVTALGATAMKHMGKTVDAQPTAEAGYPDLEISNACRARSDKAELTPAQPDALARPRQGEGELARQAVYIDCLMSDLSRLCQREHRTHLVESIRAYYKLRSGMTTGLPSSAHDPRIVSGVTHLIQDGYLARSALGGFLDMGMPRELRVALKGVKRERNSCG
jgi:hypothetical protein